MRRVAAVVVATTTGVVTLLVLPPANADRGGFAWCGESSCESSAHRTDDRVPSASRKKQRVECFYRPIDIPPGSQLYDAGGTPIVVDGPGRWWEKVCGNDGSALFGSTTLLFAPQRSPEQLREEAFSELPFPAPGVTTNPPADSLHLVNLRTWLSLGDGWGELSSTTSVPGVSVTVRAQPSRVVWDMGNGDTVVCGGPGAVYDPSQPDAAQTTDCAYRWTRSSASQSDGTFHVTATVEWLVSWSVEGAPGGGELPAVRRSTTLQMRVGEGQTRSGAQR